MPYAMDVAVDACSVRVASATIVASTFGGLIYEMLISRPELAHAISVFAVSLVSRLVIKVGKAHQGGLHVLCKYLHKVCGLSGSV